MKSEVYNPSTCIISEVAYQYYIQNKTRAEIAEEFQLSPSTLSRFLKRAKEEGLIRIQMAEPFFNCNLLEHKLENRYGLKKAIVVPVLNENEESEEIKKQVALEGARYVQRVIKDGDVIGMNWGGTMYHLIQYLNPCRKVSANIVTMHGSIANCDEKLAVKTLVRRAAMAYGGKHFALVEPGLYGTVEEMKKIREKDGDRDIFDLFKHINFSISGVGSLYPKKDSPLITTNYLTQEEIQMLEEKKACSDIFLRFIDRNGLECDTPLKDRTLSIDIETYKKIENKIIVASGTQKTESIRSLFKGDLVDVLVIDCFLAQKLCEEEE